MHAVHQEITHRRDPLGRYYTAKFVSNFLANILKVKSPKVVLDLGAGNGALSSAAKRRWQRAKFITVDIDSKSQPSLFEGGRSQTRQQHKHVYADVFSINLPKKLGLNNAKNRADVALCNPPYLRPNWREGFEEILNEAGFITDIAAFKELSADILFLAQNLRMIRRGGQAGIIVPDGLISSQKFSGLRENLLEVHGVDRVVKLPRGVFSKTDAQAHILVINKEINSTEFIPVHHLFSDGTLSSPIEVNLTDAVQRLDYDFYAARDNVQKKFSNRKPQTLGSIGAEIYRGSLTSKEAREFEKPVFHTTSFKRVKNRMKFRVPISLRIRKKDTKFFGLFAGPGDILLARVGRELEAHSCLVHEGYVLLSDCVYRIRVPEKWRTRTISALRCDWGKQWLKANSYGVGARQLSKRDLLDFPLIASKFSS